MHILQPIIVIMFGIFGAIGGFISSLIFQIFNPESDMVYNTILVFMVTTSIYLGYTYSLSQSNIRFRKRKSHLFDLLQFTVIAIFSGLFSGIFFENFSDVLYGLTFEYLNQFKVIELYFDTVSGNIKEVVRRIITISFIFFALKFVIEIKSTKQIFYASFICTEVFRQISLFNLSEYLHLTFVGATIGVVASCCSSVSLVKI